MAGFFYLWCFMEEKRPPRRAVVRCTNEWEYELTKPEPLVPIREDWYMEEDSKAKGMEYLRRQMYNQGWSKRLGYRVARKLGVTIGTIYNWRNEIIADLKLEKTETEGEKDLFVEQLTNNIGRMIKKANVDPRVWASIVAASRLKAEVLNIKGETDANKPNRTGENKQSVAERILGHLGNAKGSKSS